MSYTFPELVDVKMLNDMADKLYEMARIPVGIIGVNGDIYVKAGWQDICTKFHRVNPLTAKKCAISDQYIRKHLSEDAIVEYKCQNNLWDTAVPIIIDGEHLATLFVGQYFYEDEVIDISLFREQASRYGFDENEYLDALHRVPRFTRSQISLIMAYYSIYVKVMAENGLKNLALIKMRDELSIKVDERTCELMAANQELIAINDELMHTIEKLSQAQHQLIESEKMASLGGLVAGISHEISTPIGNAVMGVSCIQKEFWQLKKKYMENALCKNEFEQFVEAVGPMLDLSEKNLDRTDFLIRSFKQIASDHMSEEQRRFKIKPYIEEIIFSLGPGIQNNGHVITIGCDDDLEIVSYPGAIAQLITNLVQNSIKHGFESMQGGRIHIAFQMTEGKYHLHYQDNGIGMTKETMEHIYEPFYTTKRGSGGGTGLGMHIVYNLVHQRLNGHITCMSELGKGVKFTIDF